MKVAIADKNIHPEAVKLLKESGLQVSDGNAEVMVTRSYTQVNSEFLEKNPELRYVVSCTAGLDHIDMEACRKRGIKVFSAPGSNANAVAEHTIGLILAVLRKITRAHTETKKLKWDRGSFLSYELRGKILGLLGLGAIGKLVCKKLAAFEMKILAFDPYLTKQQMEAAGAEEVKSKEYLLKNSDVISIHMPLTQETENFISAKELSMMKPYAILVNTSRGGIIDEDALYNHLKAGKIWGAGLDVFREEPIKNKKLTSLYNIVLTPHIATMTEEAIRESCLQAVRKFLEDKGLKEILPKL